MTAQANLTALAQLCGIFDRFVDLDGVTRPTNPDTYRALLRANGLAVGTEAEVRDTLEHLRAGQQARIIPPELVMTCDVPYTLPCPFAAEWYVVLEGQTVVFAEGHARDDIHLPALPMGVHTLSVRQGASDATCVVICAPARTPMLPDVAGVPRVWGVVAGLYGVQFDRNAGLGDFEDLARLAEIFGPQGAAFLGINPVHALGWAAGDVISPYSPTHRGFLNTQHIAMASDHAPAAGDLIDYAHHNTHHRAALQAAYQRFQDHAAQADHAALARFTQEGGTALQDFARFESLSVDLGQDWRMWPADLRTPDLARQGALPDGAGFHIWLQWMADTQLEQAQRRACESGMALGLYLDLAVGARLDGAEAWGAGDTLAAGVALGAPPDHLSPAGQNWQLAAYAPLQLAAAQYAPLRQVLRAAMRHCGVLRIDHALGMNRSYWIPEDGSPGGYIRQPFQSLMAIITLEAHRAGTLIVGEDLGLVPDGFRDTMAAKGFYGYTVLQYEKTPKGTFRDPQTVRPQSLACFGTHDTPTIAGFWAGEDIGWWHKLGWIDDASRTKATQQRDDEKADLLGTTVADLARHDAADLRDTAHRTLGEGPAALAAVQLDDILGVKAAQNLPGTIDAHPNWRRKTPVPLDEMTDTPEIAKTARIMSQAGRGGPKTDI
ncbi:4-alpha-glucanotransferase [Roseobacter sp.]|uniref:4-alpha-glucanotransferase n=1 Tax=Roseobacter sp. TaxID=1907202 RepID=UPI00329689AE